MLVIATRHPLNLRQVYANARRLNPAIEIVVCTDNEEESRTLLSEGVGTIFLGVDELAGGMIRHILRRLPPSGASV
jgi:CPA2 family monovalent cation:H+ antiporter-2